MTTAEPEFSTFRPTSPSAEPEASDLARELSSDFPLHSSGELLRAVLQATEEVWPRRDAIDILDHARLRLQEGWA